MRVAIQGCCHGELETIYNNIRNLETRNNYKVKLLLICGDFQAIRNHQDLQCMAVPDKYKQLGGFHKYYTGQKTAPLLTLIIGGNHEASNYMWELYHGGWLAPNMYYLGAAGCVRVNGLRIAGASGIFNPSDYPRGHFETMPYDRSTLRSMYHIREYEFRKLSLATQLTPRPKVFLSHDWPQSITDHGDLQALLRRKSFFAEDIRTGKLGSPPMLSLLRTLQPDWWFAAHLHTRFEAFVVHGDPTDPPAAESSAEAPVPQPPANPDEISLDDLEDDVVAPPPPPPPVRAGWTRPIALPGQHLTDFLALDKCGGNRQHLEVVELPTPDQTDTDAPPRLTYDPEWLAISRAFHPFFSLKPQQNRYPLADAVGALVDEARAWVTDNLKAREPSLDITDLEVNQVQQFVMTAPGPGHEDTMGGKRSQPPWYTNPQTVQFSELIGVPNLINPPPSSS
ncbi:DBR1-domain-containing protein [Mycena chlorophos]|uniref:DBR1-domain-containing protein n=1 Tax=Mycena chlorophos TaxID=658473 RepID=A0A8H6W639_MYCCL|nr:DBR1-domain-containing protein [Mycena chlorophos]